MKSKWTKRKGKGEKKKERKEAGKFSGAPDASSDATLWGSKVELTGAEREDAKELIGGSARRQRGTDTKTGEVHPKNSPTSQQCFPLCAVMLSAVLCLFILNTYCCVKQLTGILTNSCSSDRGCLEFCQMFVNLSVLINQFGVFIYKMCICNMLLMLFGFD